MRTSCLALLALAACSGTVTDPSADDGGAAGDPDAGSEPRIDGGGGSEADGAPSPDAGDSEAAVMMCNRWQADRADLSEGAWSGNVASCQSGDVTAAGRANALRLLNLYRWLAELPPVTTSAALDADAQDCALMMDANNELSHEPPAGWLCYSDTGAGAAGKSNISPTPGVEAIDLYMVDPGNPTTMGHRRWFLSNGLGPVGLGSTSDYSCAWVIGGTGAGERPWTAFPPPGPFPSGAIQPSFASIDETGWTVQSDSLNLNNAVVTVTSGGQARPVNVAVLLPNYGSASAISFIPQGWTTQIGATYHIEITGAGAPIVYDVDVVDCD